ncbi:MAG: VRR-NUC domain-containing protein [Sphingobacterium sp.]
MKSEALIQSEIMLELSKKGHKVYRSNAGKVKTEDGRVILLFPKGFPDLCGWRKSDGKFFAIEVKNEKGRLRDDQKKFGEFAAGQPILYGVARSAGDAVGILDELR